MLLFAGRARNARTASPCLHHALLALRDIFITVHSATFSHAQSLGKRLPFTFLADIQQHFEGRYAAVAGGAVAYEMNTEFAPTLRDRMHFFNTDPR
jgi:hypothetical protein